MRDERPVHGETHTETYSARTQRRRWCGFCKSWTWEDGNGVFRHGRGMAAHCKRAKRQAAEP